MFTMFSFIFLSSEIFIFSDGLDIKPLMLGIGKATSKNVVITYEGEKRIYMRAKADLKDILKIIERETNIVVKLSEDLIVVSSREPVEVVELKYASPEKIVQALKEVNITPIDKRKIVIRGSETKIKEALEVIREIDKFPPKVEIEAKIVELSENASRQIGSLFRFSMGELQGGFDFSSGGGSISIKTPVIEQVITALERRGEAQVISSPRIITVEGEKAKIIQGLSVPYEVSTQFTINTIFQDAMLSLEVIPFVSEDLIVLDTIVTKNFPTTEIVSARGVPSISKNEIVSKVVLRRGESALIGGIIFESVDKKRIGVPLLSNLPVIGFLFRNDGIERRKSELIILLKPEIVASSSQD